MLKLTSRFVLQVLPYVLMALAAVVVVPGVADSLMAAAPKTAALRTAAREARLEPFALGETARDLIRQDHEAFASNGFATTGALEDR
ncbi:MAG TPA: hypothetical protein VFW22_09475 [Pseudolabrys sp.]|nr:hypothetical protein [Pseudolabrys sp.]